PHPAAPVVSPSLEAAPKSKTEVFKERMKQIKDRRAQASDKQEQGSGAGAPQDKSAQPAQGTASEPGKKGCLGRLFMAAGMLLAAGVALVHWFG
ncbi:MAG: hypothetical protein ABSE73_20130, partial [Planctomycetota bacterium]